MGSFGIVSPRTCPDCMMMDTAWAAITLKGVKPDNLSDRQKQAIMLVADGESSFITSDCPCYPILANGYWPNEVNGVYLPICPKVCVLFVEVQKNTDQYLITRIPDSIVNYINFMTAKNCIECVVYTCDTIQNLISEIPNLGLWDHCLRQVGLTCTGSICP